MAHPKIHKIEPTSTSANIAVYGPPGCGKTWFIGTAPKPVLLLDCEKGQRTLLGVDGIMRWEVTSIDDLIEAGKYLRENPDEFKTVGMDTVSEGQGIIIDGVQGTRAHLPIKEWSTVKAQTERILRGFRNLPVHFIATFHENSQRDDEGQVTWRSPLMKGGIKENIGMHFDVVGKMAVRKVKQGDDVAIERIMLTEIGDTWEAKDRTRTLGLHGPIDASEMISKIFAEIVKQELDAPPGMEAKEIAAPGHTISWNANGVDWGCTCGETGSGTHESQAHIALSQQESLL